jgi:hypothetical protein
MRIDWGAKWFELRSEMGESDLTTVFYRDGDQSWQSAHFHHRESDGFGRLQKVLREQGFPLQLPAKKLEAPSSWKSLPLLFKGILKHPVLKLNPWKIYLVEKKTSPEQARAIFLNESENLLLKRKAKVLKVTPSFLILSMLTEVLRQRLYTRSTDAACWLFPVNLRGAYPDVPNDWNCISFVPIYFSGMIGAEELKRSYQEMRQALKRQDFWAFWELYSIGKWIGVTGMRKLIRRSRHRSFWMGSFTDMGTWNDEALVASKFKDRQWILAPPGSPSYPVGISTIEWCQKRSITLKIHPCLSSTETTLLTEEILQEFRKVLLEGPAKAQ